MTVPVCGLLFSRDRALQLDATLRSYLYHVTDAHLAEMVVLYTTSNDRHADQYARLIDSFESAPGLRFVSEREFRRDVLEILATGTAMGPARRAALRRVLELDPGPFAARIARGLLSGVRNRYVLFLVDDNLFVRRFNLAELVGLLESHREAVGFSLRLGNNTTHCYAHDRPQATPEFRAAAPDVVAFDWTAGERDFGYPLELSSSLYRIAELLPLLARLGFANPNEMEARLAEHARHFKSRMPTLFCYERSAAFCNPLNRVQSVYENRAGDRLEQSAEALADLYESGRRIDVEAYTGFVPEACHQEVELALLSACDESPPKR